MSKIILITGASSGLGKATAEMLAAKGNVVYGTSRKPQTHDTIHFLQMDVLDCEAIKRGVEEIIKREGRIDVLINNAGLGIGGSIELATAEETDLQMSLFYGCLNMCRAVLPYMRAQRNGKIINVSSIGGVMGLPYQGLYSAAKFAIEGLSEALSAEIKGFGISVTLVEPGDFATGFTGNRRNSEITMKDKDYGEPFARSLSIIENEENGGLKPEVLAKRMCKIVESKKTKFRYVVANLEQWFSVVIKRILPGNWFVDILRSYYKS